MQIPREIIKEVIRILEPHVSDVEFRKTLLVRAFWDETILNRISWGGSGTDFSHSVVQQLMNFGYCVNGQGEHSFERLLKELFHYVGLDGQQNIEICLQKLGEYIAEQSRLLHDRYDQNPFPYSPTTAENVPAEKSQRQASTHYIGDQRWWWFRQRNERIEILNRLQNSWIEGVLYTALRDVKFFNIGVALKPEALLRHKNVGTYLLRSTEDIGTIYRDFDGRLLILGAPGAGKTILLLQLAEILLKEAQNDEKARIPVVFNLASWSQTQKPLDEWILDEFDTFYRVHRKIAKEWLDNNKLIVMLDGLDEVKEQVRSKCIHAINVFRQNSKELRPTGLRPTLRIVVCSRLKDYEEIHRELDLEGAITLQALEQKKVDLYLAEQGEKSIGLIEAIAQDKILREMSTIPFMLNTMIYTYAKSSFQEIGLYQDEAERRQKLFEKYIERRLQDNPSPYGYEKTLRYLKWLASKIQAHTQTIFQPRDIHLYWLDTTEKSSYSSALRFMDTVSIISAIFLAVNAFGFLLGYSISSVILIIGIFLLTFKNDFDIIDLVFYISIPLISVAILIPASSLLSVNILLLVNLYLLKKRYKDITSKNLFQSRITEGIFIYIFLRTGQYIPWNLNRFLREMSDRHILKPLSGGHVFIHRYLLESLTGQDDLHVLIQQLKNNETRAYAENILIDIGFPCISVFIYEVINNKDPFILSHLIRIAASIGLLDVEAFIKYIDRDDIALQEFIFPTLVEIGLPAIDPLIRCLNNQNPIIKNNAINLLCQLKKFSFESLVAVLSVEDREIKEEVLKVLSKIDEDRIIHPILSNLKTLDRVTQIVLINILDETGSHASQEVIHQWKEWRQAQNNHQ